MQVYVDFYHKGTKNTKPFLVLGVLCVFVVNSLLASVNTYQCSAKNRWHIPCYYSCVPSRIMLYSLGLTQLAKYDYIWPSAEWNPIKGYFDFFALRAKKSKYPETIEFLVAAGHVGKMAELRKFYSC